MSIKRQSLAFPDLQFEDSRLNALMQFIRAQAAELQKLQQMLRSGAPGQVLEKASQSDYDAGWQAPSSSSATITGGQNLGKGAGVFASISGTLLTFKTLLQGSNIELFEADDSITVSAVSTGGGTGTVTSVGITSVDLDVTGSPVNDSGSIELTIKDHVVTYARIQQTSTDAVVLGRRSGEGAGDVEELDAGDLVAMLGISTDPGYPRQLAYSGIV